MDGQRNNGRLKGAVLHHDIREGCYAIFGKLLENASCLENVSLKDPSADHAGGNLRTVYAMPSR